jgi:hypothetical protein
LKHFTKEFIRTKAIIIEAFSNLEKEKIFENKEHILMILKEIYRNKLSGNPTTLRKGICYVDCALNMADVSE